MTFADDSTPAQIDAWRQSGRKPPLQQYDKETFDRLVRQCEHIIFWENRYVDGQKTTPHSASCCR